MMAALQSKQLLLNNWIDPVSETAATLEKYLLEAHQRHDPWALAELYARAADLKEQNGYAETAAFLLTHAQVFALEAGHPIAQDLHQRLVELGREESWNFEQCG